MVLSKAMRDPVLLSKGARAEQNLWRAGEPRGQRGFAVLLQQCLLPASGVQLTRKMENLLLVPRLGKAWERIGWKGWKARQDQLHFYLCFKNKRGSDKDSTERGNIELNKPVSLMMFTADKKQSLKLSPSLFTVKKLYQHFSKSPNTSCPNAN